MFNYSVDIYGTLLCVSNVIGIKKKSKKSKSCSLPLACIQSLTRKAHDEEVQSIVTSAEKRTKEK